MNYFITIATLERVRRSRASAAEKEGAHGQRGSSKSESEGERRARLKLGRTYGVGQKIMRRAPVAPHGGADGWGAPAVLITAVCLHTCKSAHTHTYTLTHTFLTYCVDSGQLHADVDH